MAVRSGREFGEVVVAEEVDLAGVIPGETLKVGERAEAGGVVISALGGEGVDGVIGRGGGVELEAEVVCVAGVERPVMGGIADGDAAVAMGVAGERDEHEFGGEGELEGAGDEAEPFTGGRRGGVGAKAGGVVEVGGEVAPVAAGERGVFLGGDVHGGMGEIGEAAGVIRVGVGQEDVGDGGGVDVAGLKLAHGGV